MTWIGSNINEMSQIEEIKGKQTYLIDVSELLWHLNEICTPLMTPPTTNSTWNLLFIVKMKVNINEALQTLEINYISTSNWHMNI